MQPVSLFSLAAQQSRWLSVRQTAVADNIANINTPGYHAVEVEPFEKVLDNSSVSLATTNPLHLTSGPTRDSFSLSRDEDGISLMPSDNTVQMETEIGKSGEIRKAYELNTAIVKAFHGMIMMATRG